MKKTIAYLILALLLMVAGALIYRSCTTPPSSPTILLSASADAKEVLRITTIEGERVVPVTYKQSGISAFGIGYFNTRIYFDVEQMDQAIVGDTLYLRMPEPQIQILENQQYGFQVVDVWGTNIFTRLQGPKLSVAAENEMKDKAMNELRAELAKDGSVERAKTQATEMILKMFNIIPGTVILLDYTDPLPATEVRMDTYRPIDQ